MIYIDVTSDNEFVLNINNNVRDFEGLDNLIAMRSTHVLSHTVRTVNGIPTNGPATAPDWIWGTANARYIEFWMSQEAAAYCFPYDGEYEITFYDTGDIETAAHVLYKGIWKITGNSSAEENPFVEYESDNEDNTSYIYIEE